MTETVYLSGDAMKGARRAFFALNPNANDTGWDTARSIIESAENFEINPFGAYARLCKGATEEAREEMDSETAEHIAYSCGHFEVMNVLFRMIRGI